MVKLTKEQQEYLAMVDAHNMKEPTDWLHLIYGGMGAILISLIIFFMVSGKTAPAATNVVEPTHIVSEVEAKRMCQDEIQRKAIRDKNETAKIAVQVWVHSLIDASLKAPSTAQYAYENVEVCGPDMYKVKGAVDAENSFGAMLRTKYVITVKVNPDLSATIVDKLIY